MRWLKIGGQHLVPVNFVDCQGSHSSTIVSEHNINIFLKVGTKEGENGSQSTATADNSSRCSWRCLYSENSVINNFISRFSDECKSKFVSFPIELSGFHIGGIWTQVIWILYDFAD